MSAEPRRVRLTLTELELLARRCGVGSPVPALVGSGAGESSSRRSAERLGGRLGRPGSGTVAPVDTVGPAEADVPNDLVAAESGLHAAGLLRADGTPQDEVAAALAVCHAPELAVESELVLDRSGLRTRARTLHRSAGGWLVGLATADGEQCELSWMDVGAWTLELARLAWVHDAPAEGRAGGRARASTGARSVLPAVLETPWELLLATGEALRSGRHELVPLLVAGHHGITSWATSPTDQLQPADQTDVVAWHRQLEEDGRGRLHAVVRGLAEGDHGAAEGDHGAAEGDHGAAEGEHGAAEGVHHSADGVRAVVGVVEWVLLPDGWRALEPVRRAGERRVRLARVTPRDLGRHVAALVAEMSA